jgi:protoheme IX farnesyltransferase
VSHAAPPAGAPLGLDGTPNQGAAPANTKGGPWHTVRDYAALTKPSINRMCLLMTAGGLALAPTGLSPARVIAAMLGTALAVASANALNMWWERATDGFMKRTEDRPLVRGRISPRGALVFGLVLGVIAMATLAIGTNLATTLLGAFALLSYVLIYTPLKYVTPLALVVGAIPGAMPPLMGWTAATGSIDPAGLVLFATLLVWQMPHFIAITIFRRHDYARAGIRTVAVVRGNTVAKWQALAWSLALIPVSVLLTPLGVTGTLYLTVSLVLGVIYAGYAVVGLRSSNRDAAWAYRYFFISLLYLPLLVAALVVDVSL